MGLKDRIHAFAQLGAVLHAISKKEAINQGSNLVKLDQLVCDAFFHNGWFTEEYVRLAIENIGKMIRSPSMEEWLKPYEEEINKNEQSPKKIGVIMAGNIPLVVNYVLSFQVLCFFNCAFLDDNIIIYIYKKTSKI